MKKETIQAIAAALHALADEFLGSPSSPDAAPEALTGEPVTTGKRRGRPAATTGAPAPAESSSTPAPASSLAPVEQTQEQPAATTQAKTAEDLWIENKALIEPLVKSGRGTEVTAVVNKYVSGPGLKMKDIPVDKIPAFRRDIEALTI